MLPIAPQIERLVKRAGSNKRHVRWLVWSLLTLTDRIRMRHCTGQPARPPNLAHVGVLVAGEMQWELVAGSVCVPRAASQTVGQVGFALAG